MPLGLGGLSSFLARYLGAYSFLFSLLALVLIGAGHYLMFKRPNPKTIDRVILWVVTAVVIFILLFY